ncbi:hypothetical protein [Thalassotalea piscium]|uniref:Uncharacterized protein n=1 Tax=Thalassotalea piscium TaxID=1230533 RepID=A0A7X0NJ94_9GAMM|nr:hypothetical protein [Thalassotalea piscium]MBB6544473.1 hypothetical protein [Thalassotalea piscium]
MSHDENFKDSSSFIHLLGALAALFATALLPMLAGWFTLLS